MNNLRPHSKALLSALQLHLLFLCPTPPLSFLDQASSHLPLLFVCLRFDHHLSLSPSPSCPPLQPRLPFTVHQAISSSLNLICLISSLVINPLSHHSHLYRLPAMMQAKFLARSYHILSLDLTQLQPYLS